MVISIILIVLICVGLGLVVFALLKKENGNNDDYLEMGASAQLIKKAAEDADNAMEQLDALSKSVFAEFDEKYQELLFLYQMIDDLKNKTDRIDLSSEEITKNYNMSYNNPNLEKIKNMQKQGLDVSEISKALNMGQGEVKLIMELGKAR